MPPQSFTISVPQSKIDTLRAKLSLTTFPDELPRSEWDLGVPLSEMKRLVKAWESWDWRRAEERLNSTLPQFHTGVKVDGFEELDIRKSTQNPLPASFLEHGFCVLGQFQVGSTLTPF